jgi:putative ABC transport system substrate-binding protein
LYIALVILLMSSGPLTDVAGAAERDRPIRIGALTDSWGPTPSIAGLQDGLLALGYHEHEDFVIGVRFTQGDLAALPAAARELTQYGVDLIFVSQPAAAQAAQRATTKIPIVFAGVDDPVGVGLIKSFARPGGNITGVTDLGLKLSPKRLELFRELLPGLKRVLYVYSAADTFSMTRVQEYRDAAQRLGLVLVERAVRTEAEAQATLAQVQKGEVDGILPPGGASLNIPGFILETASQQGIPTMFDAVFWVERGALASYGPDFYESGRQAARIVDKIIKGASPAEVPVEVNSEIEFGINLKTAKQLGITIPPIVLFQATKVIK